MNAKRSGRMLRADEHDVARALSDQRDPAQDEGAHNELAELTIGLDQGQERLAVDLDDLARFADANANERGSAGDQVGLAGERTRSEHGHDALGVIVRPHDLDFALGDHEERRGAMPGLDEHFATSGRPRPSVGRDARYLGRGEGREQAVGRDGRSRRCEHGAGHAESYTPGLERLCGRRPAWARSGVEAWAERVAR